MILLIDNYDSFTYNLFQYVSELGKTVEVIRNDRITINEIRELNPEAIILSPGPGTPKEAGICIEVVKQLSGEFPILGICLGHQAIGAAFGAEIIHAKQIKHGKTSLLDHHDEIIFHELPQSLEVMRYHSLSIKKDTVPAQLEVTATAIDDNEIMAVKHKDFPVYGLQFHPESIGTKEGKTILNNFFLSLGKEKSYETIS
ncbi:aminodeoxychorismate/anthranilate synthase component II [Aquibacillus halophilus]|uniref:Aminodeoxychorismate/anthranilate synthase component II n=1 Tax=Aquibacillus halophilus TaxID=930132 RepID=A0A6A8DJZ5_9BACI|nr:aminodeoxychorismate/anthranilate synthase component II [Aquibacillus halophilus]MRH44079.1 aminodeoxychorismate/anthranilate synthase component II [Aquibacillus halophilus]